MRSDFDVTLRHVKIQDGYALAAKGETKLGIMGHLELLQILMIFQETNPIQPFEAEPEIHIYTRTGKFCVRTDLQRLSLYDLKRMHEPAHVLEAAQIITEIDETAPRAREELIKKLNAASLHKLEQQKGKNTGKEGFPRPSPATLALAALALLLAVGNVLLFHNIEAAATIPPEPLVASPAEILEHRQSLSGVFVNGDRPGAHAIVVQNSGLVRFMELNRNPPPSVINDTYELVTVQGQLCLLTHQPGGLIEVINKDTLRFSGELYRRQSS